MSKFKYFLLIVMCLFIFTYKTNAKDRTVVTLSKCVDGDTAYFIINNKNTKVRFLAIDTPETKGKIEPYGKEASEYTCRLLNNAKKIEIEYDIDKKDKYDRTLAWIFIDDYLLQKKIIEEGLAKVAYIYNDYKYVDILKESEKNAKKNKLNIWSDEKDIKKSDILKIVLIVICVAILYIFSNQFRTKFNKKIKRKLNKEIDNLFK